MTLYHIEAGTNAVTRALKRDEPVDSTVPSMVATYPTLHAARQAASIGAVISEVEPTGRVQEGHPVYKLRFFELASGPDQDLGKFNYFGCACPGPMDSHLPTCDKTTSRADGTPRPKIKWIMSRCHCEGEGADHEPGCHHYLCACPNAHHSRAGRHEPGCAHHFEKPEGCTCPWTPSSPQHKFGCEISRAGRMTLPVTRQADGSFRVDVDFKAMRIPEGSE